MSKKYTIPKEYLGAFKAGHRVTAREYIDEDLSWELLEKIIKSDFKDKQSMETLAYIAKFNNEYYKGVMDKNPEKNLHSTEHKKEFSDRDNARRRDIMSAKSYSRTPIEGRKTTGSEGDDMTLGDVLNRPLPNPGAIEDAIIDMIDLDLEEQAKPKKRRKKSQ